MACVFSSSSFIATPSYIVLRTSYIPLRIPYILHLTSYILHPTPYCVLPVPLGSLRSPSSFPPFLLPSSSFPPFLLLPTIRHSSSVIPLYAPFLQQCALRSPALPTLPMRISLPTLPMRVSLPTLTYAYFPTPYSFVLLSLTPFVLRSLRSPVPLTPYSFLLVIPTGQGAVYREQRGGVRGREEGERGERNGVSERCHHTTPYTQ